MSNKIKQSLSQQPNEVELSNYQFDFLNSINNLTQAAASVAKGGQLLASQYLKVIATKQYNYPADADLEFGIDLNDESHKMTIKVI